MLTVNSASGLKFVFLDNEREENPLVGERNDIMLPKLKKLTLASVENLFSFCSGNYYATWPALEDLRLKHCSNLTTSFVAQLEANMQALGEKLRVLEVENCNLSETIVSLLRYGLKNLEELKICFCEIKVVFQLEFGVVTSGQGHKLSLPSLKKLDLEALMELEALNKGPAHNLSLQNLTWLKVSQCRKLKLMFSTSIAQSLLKLEFLSIFYCRELEHIIVEEDEADQTLLQDQRQRVFFPNLTSIDIRGCPELKSMLPVTIAGGLQQLISIDIKYSSRLEEVFGIGHKFESDVGDNKHIMLPKLNKLFLQGLSSLNNFCPVGYHFILPSLKDFEVRRCPKITTRFSLDQSKSVHAEAEVPQTGNEDIKEVFPSESTLDFSCKGFDEIQKTLPPYKKILEQANKYH